MAFPVKHQQGVRRQAVAEAAVVQQAVVKGKDFGVGRGEQFGKFVLDAFPGGGGAGGKVDFLNAPGQGGPVGQVGQLLPGRDDGYGGGSVSI